MFKALEAKTLLRNSMLSDHPISTNKANVIAIALAVCAIREFEEVSCESC
jgi:hypothetical protein